MEDDKTKYEDQEPCSSKNIKQGGTSSEKLEKAEDKSDNSSEDSLMRSGHCSACSPDKTENLMKGSHGDAKIDNKNKKKMPKNTSGRVEKKKRPALKRPSSKRRPKRKVTRRDPRAISSTTIFTRRSSVDSDVCNRCRQRYCRRRCEHKLRKQDCQKCRHKIRNSSGYKRTNRNHRVRKVRVKKARVKKAPITKLMISEAVQMGSRSNMLSPLHITSNCRPVENVNLPCIGHSEITPEMIFDALRKLTMWRHEVPTTSILEYISRNNPVNTDKEALLDELLHKLTICVMMGIVSRVTNGDTWSLSCKLENRKLTKNHVTLFWKLHADTLRPVKKKVTETEDKPTSNDQACGTKDAEEKTTLRLFEEDIL